MALPKAPSNIFGYLPAALLVVAVFALLIPATEDETPGNDADANAFSATTCQKSSLTVKADEIVASGNKDLRPVAKELYRRAIRTGTNKARACAGQSLALLVQQERRDAATAASNLSWAQTVEKEWKSWTTRHSAALQPAVLTAAAILIVLLVLARLLTGTFAQPSAVAPTARRWRTALWAAGLALVIAASLGPVAASLGWGSSSWWTVIIAATTVALIALLTAEADMTDATYGRTALTVAVAGILGAILAVPALTRLGVHLSGPLVAGAAASVMGVAVLALARGVALVLEVQVMGSSGDENASAARQLVARLQTLGSDNPTNIRAIDQSDVTGLPEDALTTVPSGAWATALFNLFKVVRPAAPWRITITRPDDTCVVVAIARNRINVPEGSLVVSLTDLPHATKSASTNAQDAKDASDDADADAAVAADELLTCAAAHILRVLEPRHPVLERGMCGGTTWRALAFHAIAMRPTTDKAREQILLHAAIDHSPSYLLPRMALTNLIDDTDDKGRQKYADALKDLWDEFKDDLAPDGDGDAPARGFEAAQLRMLFNRAVADFNVRTDQAIEANPDDVRVRWTRSATAALDLDDRLKVREPEPPESLRELIQSSKGPAAYLLLDLASHTPPPAADTSPIEAAARRKVNARAAQLKQVIETDLKPLTRNDYYGLACYRAGLVGRHERDLALKALTVAATDMAIADWAPKDPSMFVFSSRDERRDTAEPDEIKTFKELVTPEPPKSYLDLAKFSPYAAHLKAYGLDRLSDLNDVPRGDLAAAAKVHSSVAQRWLDIASLDARARGTAPEDETSLQILQLLLDLGVTTTGDLHARLDDPPELFRGLVKGARAMRIVPIWEGTVGRWTGIAEEPGLDEGHGANPDVADRPQD